MTSPWTIEDAVTDTELRKLGQFFRANISDTNPAVTGTAEDRRNEPGGWATMQIRKGGHNSSTIAGINSHDPIVLAEQMARGGIADSDLKAFRAETRIISQLAVDPAYRRQGLARALVDVAEHRHRSAGAKVWIAFVDQRESDSIGFYERAGFSVGSRTSDLPGAANILRKVTSFRVGSWVYKVL